jgi:hypothetical protein
MYAWIAYSWSYVGSHCPHMRYLSFHLPDIPWVLIQVRVHFIRRTLQTLTLAVLQEVLPSPSSDMFPIQLS